MLEDPWARLERQRANASFASSIGDAGNAAGEKAEKQLSDSMIPQVPPVGRTLESPHCPF